MKTFDNPPLTDPSLSQSSTRQAEREPSPEQREIVESVVRFAQYITSRWPQVGHEGDLIIDPIDPEEASPERLPQTEPRMNYYISGSLAVLLLAAAESYTDIDPMGMPGVVERDSHPVPERARKILATFARPIGDVDYVRTDFYTGKIAAVQESFSRVGPQRYTELREQLLLKGGGLLVADVPDEAQHCLQNTEGEVAVMCDPVESYGSKKMVKIQVDGKEYYIASPDTILAYKVLHLLQQYDKKPEKFNADFGILYAAMKELYSEEELQFAIRQVLEDYEAGMRASHARMQEYDPRQRSYESKIPRLAKDVLSNPQITDDIRHIVGQAVSQLLPS